MHTLRIADRDRSMDTPVSFHRIPMFRGTAFAIRHVEGRGARVDVFSAIRTVDVIKEHNAAFGTRLSAQQALIDAAAAGRGNPANPVNRTSHCGHADATVSALLKHYGTSVAVGGKLPWWAWGVDLSDSGKVEDVRQFMRVSERLGYKFAQPYRQGSERHHVILVKSPIATLEAWEQIAKVRHA